MYGYHSKIFIEFLAKMRELTIIVPHMNRKDLTREQMYESVKALVEAESPHIQLSQQKLFTLFSIAFQYLLYRSTKSPGHYILRIQDSYLAEKLARKAKDEITRKFMYKLLLPRRYKYGQSSFHLDFFNVNTWNATKDLPQEKIQGALIVKNTSSNPLHESVFIDGPTEEEEAFQMPDLPKDYYLTSLVDFVPKTITIAFGEKFEGLEDMRFGFIKESAEIVNGVRIASDVKIQDFD